MAKRKLAVGIFVRSFRTTHPLIYSVCFLFTVIAASSLQLFANNVRLSNVTLGDKDNATKTTKIRFDIYWENSWRSSGGTNNWDAIWVFIKFRTCQGGSPLGDWTHTKISSNNVDHNPTSGYAISAASDSTGVFFYRGTAGSGTVNASNIELLWDYGANSLSTDDEIEIKAYGIEMVYIPRGNFYVGDGSTTSENGTFYTYPNTTTPYHITSEDAINVGQSNGYLCHGTSSVSLEGGDLQGPIPAAFPKGYHAFYISKYEISQGQYASFLNSLHSSVHANNNKPVSTGQRQTIDGSWPNFTATAPNRAVNWVGWETAKAYMDWAGLRPITEFEWEKAARGPIFPKPNEYAWGNDLVSNTAYTVFYDGTDSSQVTPIPGVGNMNNISSGSGALDGPWRCGIFANATTSRMEAGASYYGVMEMAGNLWEFVVSYGSPQRRLFQGTHGDGILTTDKGEATNADWPDDSYEGSGYKGGSYYRWLHYCQTSNRYYAQYNGIAGRDEGIRVVRTAP